MKLLFATSIISPHQMPLARCLAERLGTDNYRYAAMQPPLSWRQSMGWESGETEPYLLRAAERAEDRSECERWWDEADVVVCSERAQGFLEKRLKKGRLTFYVSERWWKPPLGIARVLHPRFAQMALQFRRFAKFPNFHYLPIGFYAAADMQRWAAFPDRSWMWGYFMALPDVLPQVMPRGLGLEILYAGRMLRLKRVDTLLRAFSVLRNHDKTAHLNLIGDGPERIKLEKLTRRLGVMEAVTFHSSMPMEEVWKQMQAAHIFVLPSDAHEGWGAVISEAMTQGCAVVASEETGAARTMIRHGENGMVFSSGDWRKLADELCLLNGDEVLRLRLAQAGQRTITECWSPKVAAERFVAVCEALLSKQSPPHYDTGPMARNNNSAALRA